MIRKYTEEPASPAARGELEVEISGALRDFFGDSESESATDRRSNHAGSSHVA